MKNKKRWIIILIIVIALLAIGLTLYFLLRPKAYYPESIDPRTLHASPANKEMVVGLWEKDGHVFYRFNPSGSGCTWDVDDDLTEGEASPFTWEVYDGAIMITHKLRIRGVVPRYYELDRLNAFDLRFHDAYSNYALERVEEMQSNSLINIGNSK